ncbi:dihydroorotase [Alkalinema pantanalense CENA528]|uniref:dihydroorotase n=1 Tax=Alkalinema pantanalense TaxID=1620705 RepID=UPI003D6E4891
MAIEVLQQVRVIDAVAGTDRTADVLLEDGMIQAIEAQITPPEGSQLRSGQGLILGPGLVDLYSRSGEPGHEERETLDSFMAAAIAGGFTQVNVLPTTTPAIDNPATISWIREQVQSRLLSSLSAMPTLPRLQFWGALTLETAGQQMVELGELAPHVVGFADGKAITNLAMLRRILEYLQPLQKPLMLWAYDPSLAGHGVAREGVNALKFGLPGIAVMAESAPLAAILELLQEIPVPVHFMRVSTARGVELIQAAKAQGLPVTASTTWLHLLLDTNDLGTYDPNLRLSPPLGNPSDRLALIQAVKTGVIDAIAVDHQAYTYEEKTVAFGEAPMGAIGLELAFPTLWHYLVETEHLTAVELWRALSCQPLACLGKSTPELTLGGCHDWILFQPDQTWTVTGQTLKSRSFNTHYLNQTLQGRVSQVG